MYAGLCGDSQGAIKAFRGIAVCSPSQTSGKLHPPLVCIKLCNRPHLLQRASKQQPTSADYMG